MGHLGRHHARIARDSSGLLVGVYDTDATRAAQVAAQVGVEASPSLEALLEQCDAVVIATPAATHFSVTKMALERDKHCLVEKPLAADFTSAHTLVEMAARRERVLAVGHSERFNPALQVADAFVREPLYIEATRIAPFPGRGTDVDVVKDLMVHDLEIVLHWIGAYPVETKAVGVAVVTDKVDMANARLEFPGGQVANLTASRASSVSVRHVRVFQRGGYLSADLGTRRVRTVTITAGGFEEREVVAEGEEPLRAELEDFLAAVRNGTSPRVSGSQGAEVLRLAEAIVAEIDARLRRIGAR